MNNDKSGENSAGFRPGVNHLYIRHSDLGLALNEKLEDYQLCDEIVKVIDKADLQGAQRVGKFWRIFIYTDKARAVLYTNHFEFNGKTVHVHERNPFLCNNPRDQPDKPRTKVMIHNLPLTINNDKIK